MTLARLCLRAARWSGVYDGDRLVRLHVRRGGGTRGGLGVTGSMPQGTATAWGGRARAVRRWPGARSRAPAGPSNGCGVWANASPSLWLLRVARSSVAVAAGGPGLEWAQICTSAGVALVFMAAQHFRAGEVVWFISDIWTEPASEASSCCRALSKHRRTSYSAL